MAGEWKGWDNLVYENRKGIFQSGSDTQLWGNFKDGLFPTAVALTIGMDLSWL